MAAQEAGFYSYYEAHALVSLRAEQPLLVVPSTQGVGLPGRFRLAIYSEAVVKVVQLCDSHVMSVEGKW